MQVLGYCYSDHSGLPIIVMELCHQNLQNLKRERKSFSPEDVSHILKKIAEATAFMHNQDILHRYQLIAKQQLAVKSMMFSSFS